MHIEEARIKWYVVMFAKWLASKSEHERNHILNGLNQPSMLAMFEKEVKPTPGTITYCKECQHIFVTLDNPECNCPHCFKPVITSGYTSR